MHLCSEQQPRTLQNSGKLPKFPAFIQPLVPHPPSWYCLYPGTRMENILEVFKGPCPIPPASLWSYHVTLGTLRYGLRAQPIPDIAKYSKQNNVGSCSSTRQGRDKPACLANFRAEQMFLHLQGICPLKTLDIGHPSVIHLYDDLQWWPTVKINAHPFQEMLFNGKNMLRVIVHARSFWSTQPTEFQYCTRKKNACTLSCSKQWTE